MVAAALMMMDVQKNAHVRAMIVFAKQMSGEQAASWHRPEKIDKVDKDHNRSGQTKKKEQKK